jgi:hypothetical protein
MKWRLHVTIVYQGVHKTDLIDFNSRDAAEMAMHRFVSSRTEVTYFVVPLY